MASLYPAALDDLPRPSATLAGPPTHDTQHNAIVDAIEAVQAELGVAPSAGYATVVARLGAMDTASARQGIQRARSNFSVATNTTSDVIWTSSSSTTPTFIVGDSITATVPTGGAGIYAMSAVAIFVSGAVAGEQYGRLSINDATHFPTAPTGNSATYGFTVSYTGPLAEGDDVKFTLINNADGAAAVFNCQFDLWKVGA